MNKLIVHAFKIFFQLQKNENNSSTLHFVRGKKEKKNLVQLIKKFQRNTFSDVKKNRFAVLLFSVPIKKERIKMINVFIHRIWIIKEAV